MVSKFSIRSRFQVITKNNWITSILVSMKYAVLIGSISILLVRCNQNNTSGSINSDAATDQSDIQMIRNGMDSYAMSITNADSAAGSRLFNLNGEVSFIHPRGRDTSWTQISSDIYRFFKEYFDERDLKFYNKKITVYDHKTAWVEFNWIFNATLKGDTSAIQTSGRETQIWRKDNSEWHIVHIHYSSMPK